MNVKQLKDLLNNHPDDMEIYICDGNLDISKPDNDLFLMSSDVVKNGLILFINDEYNDEDFNFLEDKEKLLFKNIQRLDDGPKSNSILLTLNINDLV